MIPSIGRTVHYSLNDLDVAAINRRRADARTSDLDLAQSGAIVHVGNDVRLGDVFPMIVTRVFGATDGGPVNGQVLLDGNDTLWVSSRSEARNPDAASTPGFWSVPPRV